MIKVQNITKEYSGRKVIDNISMNVNKGSVFGFLGQNGSGKTTTIKIIIGLVSSYKGEVLLNGSSTKLKDIRKIIGFMPESPYFYDRLSGIEFLRFCYDLFSLGNKKEDDYFDNILRLVNLLDVRNKPINTYSKGMRQRLGFAQALVNDPEFIFLDEPLDGLDPVGRIEVKNIIKKLKKEGKTVFFNSHILYDVEELCDEIGIVHNGRLLYKGTVDGFTKGDRLEEVFVRLIKSQETVK